MSALLSVRRALVSTVALPLLAGMPLAPASAASAQGSTTQPAKAAAGWLGRQFVDGNHLVTDFGGTNYPDAGLTLDAVLAFAANKTNDVRSDRALTWLADPGVLGGYIGDGTAESYAGAHGKLALTLAVRGKDARAFAGRDVLGELQALQAESGRLSDRSQWGDFSNAFGQAYGVLALDRAGASSAKASAYLAGQACTDGGVPISFEQASCTADVDATALAVQAFAASGRTVAANRAATWLVRYQDANGAFGNANSAGLAAAALSVGGRSAAAAEAVAEVRSLQLGCSAPFAQRGAIRFVAGPYDKTTAPRATTQGLLGLTRANLTTLTSHASIAWAPTLAC